MKIGYIGIGLMGFPCVVNLLNEGHEVRIWSRRKESAKELIAKGAIFCDSPAALAQESELVFTNVTDAPDVEQILFAPQGIADSKKKGLVVIDMSTISAIKTREFAKKLAELGMEFVDAPVSGGTAGAATGTLSFMVGCTAETFDRIKPVLSVMGTTITHIGESGAGQVAKSCNQICITANILGVAEAMAFAKANGVDPEPVRQALLGGFAASRALEVHALRIIHDNYDPGFKTVLHLKDMNTVESIAKEYGLKMPVSDIGTELLKKAMDHGYAEQDSSAMAKVLED